MTLATTFLVLATLGLVFSVLTFARVRLSPQLLIPTFVVGWLRGELALQTIAFEALVSVAFAWGGAFEAPAGRLGLALTLVSWALLVAVHRRALATGREIADALEPIGRAPAPAISAFHRFFRAFAFSHPDVQTLRDIPYGPALPGDKGRRNLLDVVMPKAAREGDRRPVLLQVHGGGWMIGDKREQGRPLMTHLASQGWVCVAINYRLSPQATMPAHIVDVKRSIAWIRRHIEEFGGDPDFVCITGGSAGGHLCALAALTANDPIFQPGFEEVDTRIDAAIPFYGVYDFLDRANAWPLVKIAEFVGPRVFKSRPEEQPELWDAVSPITHVGAEAPPFLVIHGTHDTLVFAEEARIFVEAMREKSMAPVLHAELQGAQHAFDVFHSVRTAHVVRGVARFLEHVHAGYRADRSAKDDASSVPA